MMSCGVYWYSPCYTLGSQSEQTAAIGPPLICSLSAMRMAGSDQFQCLRIAMSCAKGAAEEEAGEQNGGVQNPGEGLSGERLCSFEDSLLIS